LPPPVDLPDVELDRVEPDPLDPSGRQFQLRMVVTTERVTAPLVCGGDAATGVRVVLVTGPAKFWRTVEVLCLAGATTGALLVDLELPCWPADAPWSVRATAVVTVVVDVGEVALAFAVPSWISRGRAITADARVVP
jgi:hypothetical protein